MRRRLQIQSHNQNIIGMSRSSSLRKTDIGLMVSIPLTVISGLILHAVGHDPNSTTIQLWVAIHIFTGILMIIFSVMHIVQHWAWFKTIFRKFKRHSKITMLTALTFVFVSITGLMLVDVKDYWGFTLLPTFHAQAGLFFTVFAVWHCLKRIIAIR